MNEELAKDPNFVAAVNFLGKRNLTINDKVPEYDKEIQNLIAEDEKNSFGAPNDTVNSNEEQYVDELDEDTNSIIEDNIEENNSSVVDMNDLF